MRVALVVQRYGPEVLGGSESLARQYAAILKGTCAVEVLTTCALDHLTWENVLPAGRTEVDGVPVWRFSTDFERGEYWFRVWEAAHGGIDGSAFPSAPLLKRAAAHRLALAPRALQEEVVRRQGPYSTPLLDHLEQHGASYDRVLFFTYLFPTTYYGMARVPVERIAFCPTLHDEPLACLPLYQRNFARARSVIYLSESERRLAHRRFGPSANESVVGMYLDPWVEACRPPRGAPRNYVLYAGRLEASKGVLALIDHFRAYKERRPSDLKLVLIGSLGSTLPRHPDVTYLGFVDEAEKQALLRGARAFVHPSPYESFSIALLESLLAGTPVLVNRHCDVLLEHVRASGAGLGYGGEDEFVRGLDRLLGDESGRRAMGERGREYVRERYDRAAVRERLLEALGATAVVA